MADGGEVRVFVEDRDDVVRRAMPRLAVGYLVIFTSISLAAVLAERPSDPSELRPVAIFVVVLAAVGPLIRGDVWALQFGRRVRYEITPDEFRAFVGGRERFSVRFDEVMGWYDCNGGVSTWGYWSGFGYFRTSAFPAALPQYTFQMKPQNSQDLGKSISPPALFRWNDRGGSGDVSAEIRTRLGRPLNGI